MKATAEPREGRARQKAQITANQIVRMGAWKRWSTLWRKVGMPPSRAKANIMRELEVWAC